MKIGKFLKYAALAAVLSLSVTIDCDAQLRGRGRGPVRSAIDRLFGITGESIVADYYVSNTGDDGEDGTTPAKAWETISKVNAASFSAGDIIALNKGDSWNEKLIPPSSGESGNVITFTSYGTGNKPRITRSFDASTTGEWTSIAANVWEYNGAELTTNAGNIIFNEDSCGIYRQDSTLVNDTISEWYYSFTDESLIVYATSNPATLWGEIDVVLGANAMELFNDQDYITVDGIEFYGAGRHGISGIGGTRDGGSDLIGITVQNCDFKWIGGEQEAITGIPQGYRLGNGFEVYGGKFFDILVQYCLFENIYDAGFTFQGSQAGDTVSNFVGRYNVLDGMHSPMEVSYRGNDVFYDADFYNNTIFQTGGWSSENGNRWVPSFDAGLLMWNTDTSNFHVKNNLYLTTDDYFIYIASGDDILAGKYFTNQLFYDATGTKEWRDQGSTITTFLTEWQSDMALDTNSWYQDPLLTDPENSDYTLNNASVGIGMGIDMGATRDYAGNPIIGLPDVGAYENQIVSTEPISFIVQPYNSDTVLVNVVYGFDADSTVVVYTSGLLAQSYRFNETNIVASDTTTFKDYKLKTGASSEGSYAFTTFARRSSDTIWSQASTDTAYVTTPPFSTEYQTPYDTWTNKPSASAAADQNTMVETLVDDGHWANGKGFYLFGQEGNADGEALTNWINPGTYDATLVNAPTHTTDVGFDFDGVDQYADLNLNPVTASIGQDAVTVVVYLMEAPVEESSSVYHFGASDGTDILGLRADDSGYNSRAFTNSSNNNWTGWGTDQLAGTWAIVRTGSGATVTYQVAASDAGIEASTGVPSADIFIGALNTNGTPGGYSETAVGAVFVLDVGIDATDFAEIRSALNDYFVTRGTDVE